jgi:hypothetical protein
MMAHSAQVARGASSCVVGAGMWIERTDVVTADRRTVRAGGLVSVTRRLQELFN